MTKFLRIFLSLCFRKKMNHWYKTYKGDYINLQSPKFLYVDIHNNLLENHVINTRDDYDNLYHVFIDGEPVSRGFLTEVEARNVLQNFMINFNFYDNDYFMEH